MTRSYLINQNERLFFKSHNLLIKLLYYIISFHHVCNELDYDQSMPDTDKADHVNMLQDVGVPAFVAGVYH